MLGRRGFHLAFDAAKAVHQQLLQVPSRAVRAKEPQVVYVEITRHMGVTNLLRIYLVQPILLGKRLTHIVVHPVDGLLRVCILLDLPVLIVQVVGKHIDCRADQGVCLPRATAFFAIEDVRLRRAGVIVFNQYFLYNILYLLDFGNIALDQKIRLFHHLVAQALRKVEIIPAHSGCRLKNRPCDLFLLKGRNGIIPFPDVCDHCIQLPFCSIFRKEPIPLYIRLFIFR